MNILTVCIISLLIAALIVFIVLLFTDKIDLFTNLDNVRGYYEYNPELKKGVVVGDSKRLWAQNLNINSNIVKKLENLADKYNKKFIIIAADRDEEKFRKEMGNDYIYFVSSIPNNYKSLKNVYPIPQYEGEEQIPTNSHQIPWEDRINKIVWRGGKSSIRNEFFNNYDKIPSKLKEEFFDIGFTDDSNYMTIEDQLKYKYILAIGGHGWPGNMSWIMESGSIPIISSYWNVWFMPLLRPWYHYIPIEVKANKDGYKYNFKIDNIENTVLKIKENPNIINDILLNSYQGYKNILEYEDYYLEQTFSGKSYDEIIEKIKGELYYVQAYEDNDIVDFLHISKNGGTSIASLLNSCMRSGNCKDKIIDKNESNEHIISVQGLPINIYGHNYKLSDTDPNHKTMAIIRNPEDRFVSAFWFAKNGGFKNIDYETDIKFEDMFKYHSIHNFNTPSEFLDKLEDNEDMAWKVLYTGQGGNVQDHINIIYKPQIDWFDEDMSSVNLLCFDNLKDNFHKFAVEHKFPSKFFHMPHNNKSKRKDTQLSDRNKHFLRKLYSEDFELYDMACNK